MLDTLPPLQKLVQDIKLVLHDVCGLKNVAGLAAGSWRGNLRHPNRLQSCEVQGGMSKATFSE